MADCKHFRGDAIDLETFSGNIISGIVVSITLIRLILCQNVRRRRKPWWRLGILQSLPSSTTRRSQRWAPPKRDRDIKLWRQKGLKGERLRSFYSCVSALLSIQVAITIQLLEYAIPPPPPLSCTSQKFLLCPRDKKSGLQYLGNRESYHRPAGGKTTGEKILNNKIWKKNLKKTNYKKNLKNNKSTMHYPIIALLIRGSRRAPRLLVPLYCSNSNSQ